MVSWYDMISNQVIYSIVLYEYQVSGTIHGLIGRYLVTCVISSPDFNRIFGMLHTLDTYLRLVSHIEVDENLRSSASSLWIRSTSSETKPA